MPESSSIFSGLFVIFRFLLGISKHFVVLFFYILVNSFNTVITEKCVAHREINTAAQSCLEMQFDSLFKKFYQLLVSCHYLLLKINTMYTN